MTLRRIAVPALVAWLVDDVFGYWCFGLMLNSEFAHIPRCSGRSRRQLDDAADAGLSLVGFVAVAYIFAKGHDGGSGVKEGFWFGVVLGS
jgi:hypothetical protein